MDELKQNKLFVKLLALTAFAIAGCAAYFSVHGITLLFSGSMLAVAIMASTLEVGKLITTSYLYRFWKTTPMLLKAYLFSAIVILMVITSAGIYGFLTSAYQKSSAGFERFDNQIVMIENQKSFEKQKLESNKNQIQSLIESNKRIESSNTEASSKFGRYTNSENIRGTIESNLEQIKKNNERIEKLQDTQSIYISKIQELDEQILKIKEEISKLGDIQTFKFIAEAIGTDLNTIVKWFILILVIVFDPLAVGLVLAFNIATYGKITKNLKSISELENENETLLESEINKNSDAIELVEEPKNIEEDDTVEEPKNIEEDMIESVENNIETIKNINETPIIKNDSLKRITSMNLKKK